jgi:hypothetical protein
MNKLKLSTANHPKLYGLAAALGLALVLGSLLPSSSQAAPAPPSLYLNPATQNIAPNTAFTVEVHENSGTTNINALQANLSYPTANLTLNSIDYSTSAFTLQAQSVGANGVINIARGQVGGLTGDQIVAVLHFTTTAAVATANIAFTSGSGLANSATNTNILPSLSSTAGDSINVSNATVSLSANPSSVTTGGSSTLTWSSTNVSSCTATTPSGWTSSTATAGSQSVSPSATTTYTITCTGAGGTASASTVVTVANAFLDHNLGSAHWGSVAATQTLTTTAAASSNTRVVVTVSYWSPGGTDTSVTVGGANATLDKRTTNGNDIYEVWSIPEAAGLASGASIVVNFGTATGGGGLVGAISLSGVDLTNGGGVASTASATGSGTSFSSGTVTNAGVIVVGGAGNETAASTTAALTSGTKVHDVWDSGAQQGFVDGYNVGGTSIAGTFSTSATSTTGAAVAYSGSGSSTGPKAGDINGDNSVNITDLSLLLSSYGQNTTQCVTNSAYKCDLSSPGDNLVNIFDLSILLSHYGT